GLNALSMSVNQEDLPPPSPHFGSTAIEIALKEMLASKDEVLDEIDKEIKSNDRKVIDLDEIKAQEAELVEEEKTSKRRLANRKQKLTARNNKIKKFKEEIEDLKKKDEERRAEFYRSVSPERRGKDSAHLNQPNPEIKKREKALKRLIEGDEKNLGQKELDNRVKELEDRARELNNLLKDLENLKNNIGQIQQGDKDDLFGQISKEELKSAKKALLDKINKLKNQGSVSFEDDIKELYDLCEEYKAKAEAAGKNEAKYNAYINKLLEKVKKKDNLAERKIKDLEIEKKELEAKLVAVEKKHPSVKDTLQKLHKRMDNSPKGSPTEKDPMMKMIDDDLQKFRIEYEEKMARQREENQKEVDGLKQQLAEANAQKAELEKQLAAKNKPEPEKGEKCNILNHASLENHIKDLKKEIEKKEELIDELLARDIDKG
ncbi:7688_t:CDS:2, partial [Racocetra persica]